MHLLYSHDVEFFSELDNVARNKYQYYMDIISKIIIWYNW